MLKFFLRTVWPQPIPVIIVISLLGSSPKSETSHFKLYLLVVELYLERCADSSSELVFLSSLCKDGLHSRKCSEWNTAQVFSLHSWILLLTLNVQTFQFKPPFTIYFPEFICRLHAGLSPNFNASFFILKKWLLNLRFSRTMFKNNNKPIVYYPNKLRVAHIGYI